VIGPVQLCTHRK